MTDRPAVKKQMVSPQQAGEMIGVSKFTIRRLIKAGKIPAVKFSRATIRIRVADVEQYIRDHAA